MVIFCGCLLSIVGIGLMTPQRVAGANIPDWGVTVGQEIRWDTSLTMTATMSTNLQAWIKDANPSFDLTQILQSINFNHELKVTITGISDLYDFYGPMLSMMGYPIGPGDGDIINCSIVARPSGTTTWGSPGTIMADYFENGMPILNTYYALFGYSVMPQSQIDYIAGNLTTLNYSDLPISSWVKLSAMFPGSFGSMAPPLTYFPLTFMGPFPFMITPKGIDLRELEKYSNEMMSLYTPEYSLANFFDEYGATYKVNERDLQVSWGSTQFMKYAIETYGEAPWNPYAENSKADLGAYMSYDENGILSAAVLYADISATFNVDLTGYGGPNLNGESFTLTAVFKVGQPGASYPAKSDLYFSTPISNFLISLIGLCVIGGVSVVSIIFSKRKA